MSLNFLDDFVRQTRTDNLKIKQYPKEYSNLLVRVSFGQGTQAKVPWVQVVSPDMPTTNGYYPVYLMYKEQNTLILAYGIGESFDSAESWDPKLHETGTRIDELIEDPWRYGDSYVCGHYQPQVIDGEVKYFRDGQEISKDVVTKELDTLIEYYRACMDIEVKDETSVISTGLFYMEQQLEDFIIRNWKETQFGKKYDLIFEDGELKSQQFRTDIGRIDILATDKTDGSYVVIELKRNQTSDDTVGQVTRYMGWIQDKLGDESVKGIIVAGSYDEKLYYAQKMLKNIEVFLYEVNFKLSEYKR